APADSSQWLFKIPEADDVGVSFVRLQVQNAEGAIVSSNFYWLPAKLSTFDWAATTFEYTPSLSYEDLTQLSHLPEVKLSLAARKLGAGKKQSIQVTLKNPTNQLAFQVSVRAF